MTQLEIATQIFCSGKYTVEESHVLAKELMLYGESYEKLVSVMPMAGQELDIEALEERTRTRTQQLFDLGFEWNEAAGCFDKGKFFVLPDVIERYEDDDWDSIIIEPTNFDWSSTATIKVFQDEIEIVSDTVKIDEPINIMEFDFFKGKLYIEFEMPKSKLRLYAMDKQIESEADLDAIRIVASSENKEYDLGITIFKK